MNGTRSHLGQLEPSMTERNSTYDYWFRMETEVSGSPGAREKLRGLFTGMDWVVSPANDPATEGPSEDWVIEAGVCGSRWGAALSARQAFHRVCRQAPVTVDLRIQEPIASDGPPRTRWLAHHPLPATVHSEWLRRALTQARLFDTGREMFLPSGPTVREAAALAAVRPLDNTHTPSPNALPRPAGSPSAVETCPEPRQHLVPERIVLPALITAAALLIFLGVALGSRELPPLVVATASLTSALLVGGPIFLLARGYGINPIHPSRVSAIGFGWLLGCVLTGIGLVLAAGAPSTPGALPVTASMIAVFLTANGLRLLFRNVSWKVTAAWLIPALIPLVLTVLPVPGSTLHTYYLDYFDASREEVFIPSSWQAIASVKALVIAAGPLVVLGLLGYARHFHAFRTAGGLSVGVSLLCTALIATLGVFWGEVVRPASHAAAMAASSAQAGEQPPAYFGVKPRRVCLQPTGADPAPFQGVPVAPAHAYIAFPSSGDWIRLWDTTNRSSVIVKREDWQITESTTANCPAQL
ncbi:hypothetical protein [Kitasatospora sp. NPDC092286]|uniref:hypothetical protein n=1 Tax=Kitasatospora sp. NPDC092286 TaxID=3364087 RepID=UPI00381D7DC4